jgi:hypothetical protein
MCAVQDIHKARLLSYMKLLNFEDRVADGISRMILRDANR